MIGTAGGARLARQALRVDRTSRWSWAIAVGAMVGTVGLTFNRLYPTAKDRAHLATAAASPVLRTILGPLLAPQSTGGLVAWRMGAILLVVLGLATTFLVVRRTRAEEQRDRGALVLAAPVGRSAPVAAALLDAAALDVLAGALAALALVALAQPAGGALLFGASLACGAWWFGAVAAVVAQLVATSKGANGAAAAVVAAVFMLRALGELYVGWLLWLNPLAWVSKAGAFAHARPAVLALPIVTGALVGALAASIASRREFGTGLLRPRVRPSRPLEPTPSGLAWRLERTAILATTAAVAAYSVAIGSMVGLFNSFLKSSPTFAQSIERYGGTKVLEDAFTKFMATYGAIAIGAWAVSMVLRLHAEEERGRVTVLVAGSLPRRRVFDGFCATALGASVLGVLVFGTGLGIGRALADHRSSSFARGVAAGLVSVPPMLVLVAIAMLAVGASQRTAPLAWAGVVWCAVVGVIGTFLGLPQLVLDTSPFTHVPSIPLAGDWWLPGLVLVGVAAVLGVTGRLAYERRAIGGP